MLHKKQKTAEAFQYGRLYHSFHGSILPKDMSLAQRKQRKKHMASAGVGQKTVYKVK